MDAHADVNTVMTRTDREAWAVVRGRTAWTTRSARQAGRPARCDLSPSRPDSGLVLCRCETVGLDGTSGRPAAVETARQQRGTDGDALVMSSLQPSSAVGRSLRLPAPQATATLACGRPLRQPAVACERPVGASRVSE